MPREMRLLLAQIVAFSLLHSAMPAFSQGSNIQGALGPDKLQQVKATGQAVLAARRGVSDNSDMQDVQQILSELKDAVHSASQGIVTSNNLVKLPAKAKSGETAAATSQAQSLQAAQQMQESRIHGVAQRLREKREIAQLGIKELSNERERLVRRTALEKLQELEDQLDEALKAPAEDRAGLLLKLKDRLDIKPQDAVQEPQKTPTISSIVRHRAK